METNTMMCSLPVINHLPLCSNVHSSPVSWISVVIQGCNIEGRSLQWIVHAHEVSLCEESQEPPKQC